VRERGEKKNGSAVGYSVEEKWRTKPPVGMVWVHTIKSFWTAVFVGWQ